MLNAFFRFLLFSLLIVFISWILPGIDVENFFAAMFASIVIALINTFVKPFLEVITLPVNYITLGLFSLVLNALLLMLAGFVTPGFEVEGFFSAFIGAIIIAVVSPFISKI